MIVCLRTVLVPSEWRGRYLDWIEAGIATPFRDVLTSSEVHRAVSYRPITRYEVTGGYLNFPGLSQHDPSASHPTGSQEQS